MIFKRHILRTSLCKALKEPGFPNPKLRRKSLYLAYKPFGASDASCLSSGVVTGGTVASVAGAKDVLAQICNIMDRLKP